MASRHPQIVIIDHVTDPDRKLASIDFQRQQLQVGRDAICNC